MQKVRWFFVVIKNATRLNRINPSKIFCLTRIKPTLHFEISKMSGTTGLVPIQSLRKDVSHRHVLSLCSSAAQADLFGSLFKCWVKQENWFLSQVVSDSFTNPGGSWIGSWAKYTVFLRIPYVWMLKLTLNPVKLHSLGTLCASANTFCVHVVFCSWPDPPEVC